MLSSQQLHFCEKYIKSFNITDAALHAGFQFSLIPGEKYFVYALVDPVNEQIFYIGKGKGKRPYNHIADYKNNKSKNYFKHKRISDIMQTENDVSVIYLAVELDEVTAYEIERGFIKAIGTENLTNIQGGIRKESYKQWALNFLGRLRKLSDIVQKARSPLEIEIYLMIVGEVTKISNEGFISELHIDKHGAVTPIIRL